MNATGNGASSGEQSATPAAGNNPPTVQNPLADLTLVAGTTQDVDVSGTFDDHDGINDTLTYTANSDDTSVATVSLSETTLTVSGVAAGDTTVTVSASDSSASASDTFEVNGRDGHAAGPRGDHRPVLHARRRDRGADAAVVEHWQRPVDLFAQPGAAGRPEL